MLAGIQATQFFALAINFEISMIATRLYKIFVLS